MPARAGRLPERHQLAARRLLQARRRLHRARPHAAAPAQPLPARASLGALLRDELNLTPQPRGTGTSKTNYTNYRFDEAGERRLSEWMRQHLRVAVYAVSNPPELEPELIRAAHPPLNLTGWPNPERAEIKRARKQCADAARRRR